jgi:hypothetical protein
MSYVRYNESLYRTGFRPYGLTNPRGATQLGAIPRVDHGWGGFGPWQLHGYPFSESGGWALHGLAGGAIPNGTIFTYQGTWSAGFPPGAGQLVYLTPQDVADRVVAALNGDGQLSVAQAPTDLNTFSTNVKYVTQQQFNFPARMVLQVTNGQGFLSINDAISIIRHYVYAVTGRMPASDQVTGIHIPQDPNAAAASPTNIDYTGAGDASAADQPNQPTDWGKWFSDNFGTIALAVGALAILPPLLKRVF